MTRAWASSSILPIDVVTVPGFVPVALKVVSRLPSVLYLTRVKTFSVPLNKEYPATTILWSDWMPRALATASPLPIDVVTVPGFVPVALKVVSRLPSVLYLTRAKS